MYFKIMQAYEKEKTTYITGRFSASNEEEKELLDLMVETFESVPVYNNKFACNGKTLLFKSVRADLLMDSLMYIGKELEVPFKFILTKNFVGSKELVKKWLTA